MSNSLAKTIRNQARLSQSAAAALAGCSPNSWRLFEAAPDAVTPAVRSACEQALSKMASGTARAG